MLISLSAIPLKLAVPIIRGWDKNKHAKLFAKFHAKYRIYVPLDNTGMPVKDAESEVRTAVEKELAKSKIEISNYVAGTCTDGRRMFKIGRLLPEELQRKFANDPVRKGFKASALVVVSRHPYDILGMSFDRGWKSCTNFVNGEGRSYALRDIRAGALIAYLIKNDDKNINNPIARTRILPYEGTDRICFVPDTVYGHAPPAFTTTVEKFCDRLNSGIKRGVYTLPTNVYHESVGLGLYIGHAETEEQLRVVHDSKQLLQIIREENVRKTILGKKDAAIARNLFANAEVARAMFDRVMRAWNDNEFVARSIMLSMVENNSNIPHDLMEKLVNLGPDFAVPTLYNRNVTQELLLKGLNLYPEIAAGLVLYHRSKEKVLLRAVEINPKLLETVLQHAECPEYLIRENVDKFPMSLAFREEPWVQQLVVDFALENKRGDVITNLLMNTQLDAKIRESLWDRRTELAKEISGIRWFE